MTGQRSVVRDGDVLALGNVTVEVVHTPGHTPEHVCLLVTDRTRAEEPWLALTGHTLMVGDVGRTELATNAEEGGKPAATIGFGKRHDLELRIADEGTFVNSMLADILPPPPLARELRDSN